MCLRIGYPCIGCEKAGQKVNGFLPIYAKNPRGIVCRVPQLCGNHQEGMPRGFFAPRPPCRAFQSQKGLYHRLPYTINQHDVLISNVKTLSRCRNGSGQHPRSPSRAVGALRLQAAARLGNMTKHPDTARQFYPARALPSHHRPSSPAIHHGQPGCIQSMCD